MTRLAINEQVHRDDQLRRFADRISGNDYLAIIPYAVAAEATPTITSVATTTANWTAVATGLSNVLQWRLSELNGNDFYYAYVAAPGDNFNVGFGWISYQAPLSALYVKRTGGDDITVKLEYWAP